MTRHPAIISIAVVCITLSLGLWPFHAPRNEVAWRGNNQPGLRFGRYSVVVSSASLPEPVQDAGGSSLHVWLQPALKWNGDAFLSFYRPRNSTFFSLVQSHTDLLLQSVDRHHRPSGLLSLAGVFRQPRPVFVTITSGTRGTLVYLDGVLERASPFRLPPSAFTGRLVVGDAPRLTNSWSGDLLGLAVFHQELTAAQVLRTYTTWKQTGRPEITPEERNVALYLFDEHSSDVVHDQSLSRVDLNIPRQYTVLDQVYLEPFWNEFSMTTSYWSAVLKNVVGFMPLGFCFYACLAGKARQPILITIAIGAAVSFTIEFFQAYLPTRDSGTTDLITNSLGTWIGAAAYRLTCPALLRAFPWLRP